MDFFDKFHPKSVMAATAHLKHAQTLLVCKQPGAETALKKALAGYEALWGPDPAGDLLAHVAEVRTWMHNSLPSMRPDTGLYSADALMKCEPIPNSAPYRYRPQVLRVYARLFHVAIGDAVLRESHTAAY